VFSKLLPGNDSFAAVHCNGNMIYESFLSNGRLALAPLCRLSAVTSQYFLYMKIVFLVVLLTAHRGLLSKNPCTHASAGEDDVLLP
jgi:hypothetical protein